MRKLGLFFMILICFVTVVHIAEAHDPKEIALSNAWTIFDNEDRRVVAAVIKLNNLNGKMEDIKSSWDSANKAQRDGALSMLASIAGKSPAGFVKDCVSLGLSISEEMSLRNSLSDAISQVESQYSLACMCYIIRGYWYKIFMKRFHEHNENHLSQRHLDFKPAP